MINSDLYIVHKYVHDSKERKSSESIVCMGKLATSVLFIFNETCTGCTSYLKTKSPQCRFANINLNLLSAIDRNIYILSVYRVSWIGKAKYISKSYFIINLNFWIGTYNINWGDVQRKKCCKQWRHVKFKGTMTKRPLQKQTHRTAQIRRTPRPNKYSE